MNSMITEFTSSSYNTFVFVALFFITAILVSRFVFSKTLFSYQQSTKIKFISEFFILIGVISFSFNFNHPSHFSLFCLSVGCFFYTAIKDYLNQQFAYRLI